MKNRPVLRRLALLVCLTLLFAMLPAASADETEDVVSAAAVDPEVEGQGEIPLSPSGDAGAGPSAAPSDPDVAPVDPDAAPADPDAAPADPDAAPADPDAAPADPDAVPADPNAAPVDPNAAPADPDAAPADPDAVPAADPELDAASGEGGENVPASGEAEPEEPEEPYPEVEGWTSRIFDETLAIQSDSWNKVNLMRAHGFEGKLAAVKGTLTLKNPLFEGVAIQPSQLTDYIELGPYGAIVMDTDAKLKLNVSAFSFNRGDKRKLTLRWKGKNVSGKKAKWYSSNSSVVKVNKSGKLTAKRPGEAVISVKYKKNWVQCKVVVTNFIYVKNVKVPKKMTLLLNTAYQMKATVSPANAVDAELIWYSSNPAVASVDQDGLVSGLSSGKAYIYAKTVNGVYGRCKVTVKYVAPSSVWFSKAFVTLNPGDTAQTEYGMSPSVVSNPRIQYSTGDSSVATIDENGVITAVGVGRTKVYVRSAAHNKVCDSCTVFVVEPGSGRLAGLVIGINPGHQTKTIKKKYPLAPGSKKKAYGCKVGASGRWTRVPEYEVVLQIGLKLQKLLTDAGATVVMTRTTNNVWLTNIDRARILNKAGVDVALQLHCNSNKKKSHHGCSAYVRTTGGWYHESKAIGKVLVRHISANTGMTNKGVKKYNGYMSLNWTTTPSVLLEMGYLSNKTEDRLLATDAFRDKIAQGIFEGLCEYYGR